MGAHLCGHQHGDFPRAVDNRPYGPTFGAPKREMGGRNAPAIIKAESPAQWGGPPPHSLKGRCIRFAHHPRHRHAGPGRRHRPHILKSVLHVSTHGIARLTRTENGIRVNGAHARTVDRVRRRPIRISITSDRRPPKVRPTPGPWPLPVVWEDAHLLVVNKPAGMTAHASNFLPDTPTVAGALAGSGGRTFCSTR